MRYERAHSYERLDRIIGGIARAYGFSTAPVIVPKKDLASDDGAGTMISAVADRIATAPDTQAWGMGKQGGGTVIAFVVAAPKHAIAQAFVVKSALATVEAAGFSDCTVLISSVGDNESRRRYLREIGTFFRKHGKDVPENIHEMSVKDPDGAVKALQEAGHPLAEMLPKTIDLLSEASRAVMLETLSLFERLEIPYELAPRLTSIAAAGHELVFAIEGTLRGERVKVAQGGRLEHGKKDNIFKIMGMSVSVPSLIDPRSLDDDTSPACFVIHVGEAAKLKAFVLLESLWKSHVALGQALLAGTLEEQLARANRSGAKYLAIVGQREALEGTVIVKNLATQLQETVPLDRAVSRLARIRV